MNLLSFAVEVPYITLYQYYRSHTYGLNHPKFQSFLATAVATIFVSFLLWVYVRACKRCFLRYTLVIRGRYASIRGYIPQLQHL